MKIKNFINKKPFVIAGPCSAESENQLIHIAKEIKSHTDVFRAGCGSQEQSQILLKGLASKH